MERDSAERFELDEEDAVERFQGLKKRFEDVQVRHKELERKEFLQLKRKMEALNTGIRPEAKILRPKDVAHFQKQRKQLRGGASRKG